MSASLDSGQVGISCILFMRLFLPLLITINCCSVFQLAHRTHTFFSQPAAGCESRLRKNKNDAVINAFDWLWSRSGPLFQIEMVLHRWEALSIKYKVTDQPYKDCLLWKVDLSGSAFDKVKTKGGYLSFFQPRISNFYQRTYRLESGLTILSNGIYILQFILSAVCHVSCVIWSPGPRMRSTDHMNAEMRASSGRQENHYFQGWFLLRQETPGERQE